MTEPTGQTIQWSAADVAAAREALAQATPGKVTRIVTLTDEEIVILDGLQNDQLVALPWLSEHEDADRELIGQVALRSLITRGMVAPEERSGEGGPDDVVGIRAMPQITGSLVLRRTAQAILSAQRTTSLGVHWVYLYFHENDIVLEEEVSGGGQHAFSVYPTTEIGERLATFMDPARAAVMDGRARQLTIAEFEAAAANLPELSEARAVTTLSAVRVSSDVLHTVSVYTGPRGVYLVDGGERAEGVPAELSLKEIGRTTLRNLPLRLATQ